MASYVATVYITPLQCLHCYYVTIVINMHSLTVLYKKHDKISVVFTPGISAVKILVQGSP